MRRARLLALAALLLLAASAWLSGVGEARPPALRPKADVEFPRYLREAERERARRRRTVQVAVPAPAGPQPAAAGDEPAPARRDPFLLALPGGDGALVLEANALRHSRLGELLVACVARDGDAFARLHEETGIDPLKDLDRIAVAGELVLASGFFDRARLDRAGARAEPYGSEATLYRPERGDGPVVARWRDQLLALGSEDAVRRAIDQVEGRSPAPPPLIPDDLAYGEAYGVLQGDALRRAVDGGQGDLQERLLRAASRVELHADAMRDVALTVSVSGPDEGALRDLAKAAAGALAAARVDASLRKEAELADLLELAAVHAGPRGVALEVAVPEATLERWFAHCREPPRAP